MATLEPFCLVSLLAPCSWGRRQRAEDSVGWLPAWPTCHVLPVQVRLQTQNAYRGIVDCMVKIYRHESVGGCLPWAG